MSGALRTFFAVEIGDAARREATALTARLRREPGGDDVRWVRPEALHVTLRFLGATPDDRVDAVVDCVTREVAAFAPFVLRLGSLTAFPNPRHPRVVVLEVEPGEPLGPLGRLAAAVERGVVAAGFEPDLRAYRGHLTLGRVRSRRRRPGRSRDAASTSSPTVGVRVGRCEPAPFDVAACVLFRSDLHRDGARYTPLARIALGASGAPGGASDASRSVSPH